MDDKVKHQHYVPVMYLKRFVGSDGQLYAFDINKRSGVRNLPRVFAQVSKLRETEHWDDVRVFMKKEYRSSWLNYERSCLNV